MNVPQRLVLSTGAISVLWVTEALPRVFVAQGSLLRAATDNSGLAAVIDVRSVVIHIAAFVIATVLLFIALRSRHVDRLATLELRLADVETMAMRIEQRLERELDAITAHLTEPNSR